MLFFFFFIIFIHFITYYILLQVYYIIYFTQSKNLKIYDKIKYLNILIIEKYLQINTYIFDQIHHNHGHLQII